MNNTDEEGRKKVIVKKTKCQECGIYCCDRKNKKCMGKTGVTWILVIVFLLLFWGMLIGLTFVFYEIFVAIEGDRPDMKTATMKQKTPMLTDTDVVEDNVKGGWSGDAINLPFLFGAQLFFPGISPITMDVWKDADNKTKKDMHDEYEKNPVFSFVTDDDGRPTAEWVATQRAIYADYFNKYYKPVTKNSTLCEGHTDEFREPSGQNGKCTWPVWTQTSDKSFPSHYCLNKPKLKCLPYLYFVINDLFGWLPQMTSPTENFGNVRCELDPDDVKNEELNTKKDFVGSGGENCKNATSDFCGVLLARFPYYGEQDRGSPIVQYKITKMPERKEEFVIRCRLDYPGYEKQMAGLSYPFSYRKDRTWTKIRISGASPCLANLCLSVLATATTVLTLIMRN